MQRRLLVLLLVLALEVSVLLIGRSVLVGLARTGALSSRQYSMDVTAGRARYEQFVLGVRDVESVYETRLSKLYREVVGEPPPPVWVATSGDRGGLRYRTRWDSL